MSYLFSVSMCVYGGDNPEWFRTAVESVLNQTVKPSEVVLVVDGPIPNELDEIIIGYEKDSILKVIRLETNRGHGNARRIGLENCRYDLVALMDADDVSKSSRFEEQIKVFSTHGNVDIVGGNISEFIDTEDNIVAYRNVPTDDLEIKKYLKKRCPFNQVSVMFKKSAVMSAGGYIDWFWNEDYYLWIRMLENGAVMANTGTVLVNVRTGKDMYKRRGGIKYFKSEKKLQRYMFKHKIIGFWTYISNVSKRFIVQVLMPNNLRGWVFKRFARRKTDI